MQCSATLLMGGVPRSLSLRSSSSLVSSLCWETCNFEEPNGDGQTIAGTVQNCEGKVQETKSEESRIILSLLVLNLRVQCYIFSMHVCMSIQHYGLKGTRQGITEMSQQAAAGRGAPAAGRAGRGDQLYRGRGDPSTKGVKSRISKIVNKMFNTGQNRFAAQFTQARKNVANYLQ